MSVAGIILVLDSFTPIHAATYSNGTGTATFDVSMKIVANCVIAASPLDFGQTQGVLSAAVNVNTSLSVTCTNTTPYNVGLNAGTGSGSSGTTRFMAGTGGNTATISFNLFQTAGATLWGDTQGTNTVGGVGNGAAQSLTVYGQVPAQSTPIPDTYRSTITATVYF
ncbi:Csu type fimbrial protein [Pseudoduganella violaceinigra]|uniref:Csu type fimbrial protein n=1 Tax=Pseudoduganella violaceinigra TaxID=246602 RepID=UPI000420111E|nr:spore coat U domain-containing protein [Pseudoduganella violaceinigra]